MTLTGIEKGMSPVTQPKSPGLSNDEIQIEQEDWLSFRAMLTGFPDQDIADIDFVYHVAEVAHRGQVRRSGGRFFSHPSATAINLLKVGIRESVLIKAALFHDVLEDTDYIGRKLEEIEQGLKKSLDDDRKWTVIEQDLLDECLGQETAMVINELRKLPDVLDLGDEHEREYVERMSNKALMVKMADRLHNLETMACDPKERQKKQIEETRHYIQVFERALDDYSVEGRILLTQIDNTLKRLRKDVKKEVSGAKKQSIDNEAAKTVYVNKLV